MVRLGPERVLLVIGGLEDIDAENKDGTHCRNPRPAQMHGVGGGVAALGGVQERNPGEIAEGEHEAQSVVVMSILVGMLDLLYWLLST